MDASFYPPKFRDGKILAFADVDVASGVIVRGFRIVRAEDGLFAAVPSRGVSVGGKTRYFNQVAFASSEIRDRFLASLLESYFEWERGQRVGEAESRDVTSASG